MNPIQAQTNPTVQGLPFTQNFGTTTFTAMPTGCVAWTVNSSPIGSQTNAQNNTPNGNAGISAATTVQSTGGCYGYATGSNGRFYVQTSSNTTNGTSQLACAVNTGGWSNIKIAFDVEMISANPRTIGVVLQYRIGTTGAWLNVTGGVYSHNSSDRSTGATDNFTNLTLPQAAENNAVVQLRWAIWRGSETGNSSGIAIDNISVTATSSQTAGYFRSKQNGNWNDVNTWEASADNSTWSNATASPDYTANTITIQNGNTVTLTATDTIDQVVVNGKLMYADFTGSTPRINNGAGCDLIINGTFEDLSSISIAWASEAIWSMGSNGTIIRTRSTSANNWRDKYDEGIAAIPATATWILRKTGTDNPTLSSTGNMVYPNLIIENNTGTTWGTASTPGFTGTSSAPVIKGSLDIGGNGTGNVSFINDNTFTTPVLVIADLTIKAGSTLRSYGTGFTVQGNLTVNGTIDYGTSNSQFVFSGNNNQTIAGTGTISFLNVHLNKTSASATVTLQSPATVNGVFTFTNGHLITTATNLLTFANTASATGGSNNSFVEGITKKIGNTAFTFPIGKSNNYQPISISAPANSAAAYTAEYFHADAGLGIAKDSTIDSVSTCEYWTLNNVGTVYPVSVTLGWNNLSCAIAPGAGNMRLTDWNGSKWEDLGNSSSVSGIVSSLESINNFGAFTLAQKSPTLLSDFGLTITGSQGSVNCTDPNVWNPCACTWMGIWDCPTVITACVNEVLTCSHGIHNYTYFNLISPQNPDDFHFGWDLAGGNNPSTGGTPYNPSFFTDYTLNSFQVSFSTPGLYFIHLTFENMYYGAAGWNSAFRNVVVRVNVIDPPAPPTILINPNPACDGSPINVISNGTETLDWGDGTVLPYFMNPYVGDDDHIYASPGSYPITVVTTNQCGTNTATQTVTVNNTPIFDPIPSGNTTWTSVQKKISGYIVVHNTEVFTIERNSTVEFDQNSGFLIESGGVLNITEGSILKGLNSCSNMWGGIVVQGNNYDVGTGINTVAGICNVNTSSTIRDANIGISALRGIEHLNASETGNIRATDAIFVNNLFGIKMDGYYLSHTVSLSGRGYVIGCQFKCDAPLLVTFGFGFGTENFIQLSNIKTGLVINNNNFYGNTAFADLTLRGIGIASTNASYTAQNNHFNDLFMGINQTNDASFTNIKVVGNTFTNIPFGIKDNGGVADEFSGNHFLSIPSADILGTHTYGMFMISSSGFMIRGNEFNGDPSILPSNAGSHGIVFENTGESGGVCFDNNFSLTDYGIHTQGTIGSVGITGNQNLVIRCNHFSHDAPNTPHRGSAWYTESGSLKRQGNSDCGIDPAEAAGNTWESTTSILEQDVFTNTDFLYYANPTDQNGFNTTKPNAITTTAFWTGYTTNCLSAAGLPTCIDPDKGRSPLSIANQQRLVLTDSISKAAGDLQLEVNRLLREYLQNDDFENIETLLTESGTAESEKLLAQYYLGIKNYSGSRTALGNIISATVTEAINQDSTTAALNTIENANFCAYMNVMIDLSEVGKTIPELDSIQLNTLNEIANAHVKVSANAETVLTIALNEHYSHPILKGINEQSRANHTIKIVQKNSSKDVELKVYPNPFSETTTVEYIIPKGTQNSTVYLFDVFGTELVKLTITETGDGKLIIDGSALKSGIYFCRLLADKKTISVCKLVIIK